MPKAFYAENITRCINAKKNLSKIEVSLDKTPNLPE